MKSVKRETFNKIPSHVAQSNGGVDQTRSVKVHENCAAFNGRAEETLFLRNEEENL